MKAAGFVRKQPAEKYETTFDFSTLVTVSGETISTYTVTATDGDGTDVTSTIVDSHSETTASDTITVVLKGGTAGYRYDIEVVVTSTGGDIWELDKVLEVLEQP